MYRFLVIVLLAVHGTLLPAETTLTEATDGGMPPAAEGFSRGGVARGMFTTQIVAREPGDEVSQLRVSSDPVYFFSELMDMSGHTAIHRWEHDGQIVAEVKFDVRGSRWRVWSSKLIPADQTGTWKVSVVNTVGEVLKTSELHYGDSTATP